jgi:hypothetical protein
MTPLSPLLDDALKILQALGMPPAQQNERSALTLLALLNLFPGRDWTEAEAPLMGVTPIMQWMEKHYQKGYAPNTRETVRRQTLHQFLAAGMVTQNPDDPARPVNSPKTVYQIEPDILALIRTFKTKAWQDNLSGYLDSRTTLIERYAKSRRRRMIPLRIRPDQEITLSAGKHSELIKAIVESFAPRFVPDSQLIYVGDTGNKWGYFDEAKLADLGVRVDAHGKMPDVVLYYPAQEWLVLVEAVTSHGPVDSKRHAELCTLFANANLGRVYVTAFPNRATLSRYLHAIAWETEVWVADAPDHLIHFDGERFLGPYPTQEEENQ